MINSIRLQRFRSYRDESFEFDPGVNIIVGPNASGKTNLLEALLVACTGSSYRAKDSELIAHGAPWARIDSHGSDGNRTVKLMVRDDNPAQPPIIPGNSGRVKKEFVIKDQKLTRLTLQRTVPVVMFEPNHLLLLSGTPELRRDYLDNILEQTKPGYGKIRRDYRRALAQRNALLKHGLASGSQLFAWNIRLSEIGAQVALARHELVAEINDQIGALYHNLAHSKPAEVGVTYAASCDIDQYGSSLLKGLEKRQDTDLARGFTTIGPHREDLIVSYDGRDASEVASRGETRTILLALKIMEVRFIEEVRGAKPILLLDDVFSELDGARRRALPEVIEGYQTFITTTDADVVIQHFMDKCRIIPLGG